MGVPVFSYFISKHWTGGRVEPTFGLSDVSDPFALLRMGVGHSIDHQPTSAITGSVSDDAGLALSWRS
jgi:hypothetical protein